jgi:3-oxoacyl-[acyl-carrier protein] reductase
MKHILVTGANSGLGKHIAARALENGYSVTGLARRLPESDPGFPFLQADVTDASSVAAAFEKLRDKGLYGLVNAAGVAAMNLLLMTPPETMARVVCTNLLGTMHCCAEAAKLLIRGTGGRIVNFSSIAVPLALSGESVYAASKAGVETFSRCLARELSTFGVTVNAVAPGPVATPMLRGLSDEQINAVVDRQVIRRQSDPDDVWAALAFLLGDQGAMISGQTLRIGGV